MRITTRIGIAAAALLAATTVYTATTQTPPVGNYGEAPEFTGIT
ncbi:hypothetical protein [Cupriavidus sp. KK10]|nr:hypothetical protein [Cupriavidus sp. KK10]